MAQIIFNKFSANKNDNKIKKMKLFYKFKLTLVFTNLQNYYSLK